MLPKKLSRGALLLAAFGAAPSLVHAQSFTWTTPTNANFSNGPWSPATPSWGGGASVGLDFSSSAVPYTATNDLGAPFLFNGGTLRNGVTLASAPGNLLSLAGGSSSFALPGGNTAITSRMNLGTALLLDGASSSNLSLTGVLTGPGALYLTSSGTVNLSGANQNTGTTNLIAGTLNLSNDNALGTGSLLIQASPTLRNPVAGSGVANVVTVPNRILLNNGTLTYNAPALADMTLTGPVSSGGGIAVTGAGALRLTAGTNTFSGGITLDSGTTAYNARLIYSGSQSLGSGSITFAGPGVGELIFNGLNSATVPQITVQNTATAILAPATDVSTMNVGALAGAGTLILGEFSNAGTFNMSGTPITNTGAISFFSGVTKFSLATLGGGSMLFFDGGTVMPTFSWSNNRSLILSSNSALCTPVNTTTTFGSGISLDPLAIGDALVKSGAGTLVLQGNSTCRFVLDGGTMSIDTSNGAIRYGGISPALTVNCGGVFFDSSSLAAGNLPPAGTLSLNGGFASLTGPESTGTLVLGANTANEILVAGSVSFAGIQSQPGTATIYATTGTFGFGSGSMQISRYLRYSTPPSGSLLLGAGGAAGTPAISILSGAIVQEADRSNQPAPPRLNFATYDAPNGIRALNPSEYATTIVSGASDLNNASLNTAVTLTAPTTINSLSGGIVIGNTTLSVGSGMILAANVGVATLSFPQPAVIFGGRISSVIDGSSVLIDGSTSFSGANQYTGPTVVAYNTLTDDASEVIPDTSVVYVNNGFGFSAIWDLNGNTETVAGISQQNVINSGATFGRIFLGTGALIVGSGNVSSSFSGNISGSGRLIKIGTGTLALSGKGSTYSNGTLIRQGVLSVEAQFVASSPTGNPSDFAGAVRDTVSADAILGTGSIQITPARGDTGELHLGRGVTHLSRPITVGLTIAGTGTGILTSDLDPNRGTPTAFGPTISSTITLNTALQLNLSGGTLSGVISGLGSITVNGPSLPIVTISNATNNTYTGSTSVINGSLYINPATGIGTPLGVGTSPVNLGSSATTGYAELSLLSSGSFSRGINVTPGQPGSTLAVTSRSLGANGSNLFSGSITLGATALRVFSAPNPVNGAVGTALFSGAFSGSGSLLIGGGVSSSTVWLETSASTYTGGTTLTDGTLALGGSSTPTTGTPTSGPIGAGSLLVAGGALPPTIVSLLPTLTISNPLTLNSDVNFAGGGELTFSNSITYSGERVITVSNFNTTFAGPISGNGFLDKDGAGTLLIASSNTFSTGISVFAGSLQFGASETMPVLNIGGAAKAVVNTGGDKVLRMNDVNIATSGVLDLTDNDSILDYSGASPFAKIAQYLTSGYNGGHWNGSGINSSRAAAIANSSGIPNKTAIGFAEASALGIGSFDGQPVDGTAIVMRYTYEGDANLDGIVNALDFNAVASNFGVPNRTWVQGDFTYDGSVNTSDFVWISTNFGQALPATALGSVAPEPTAVVLLLLPLVTRRRRWR